MLLLVALAAASGARALSTACPAPYAWTCAPDAYAAGDGCDCGCGVYDPDCDTPHATLRGCGAGEYCREDATCAACGNDLAPAAGEFLPLVSGVAGSHLCPVRCFGARAGPHCDIPAAAPDEWTCDPALYNARDGCHCNCGPAVDPDCVLPGEQEVVGCAASGQRCSPHSGECVDCDNFPVHGQFDGAFAAAFGEVCRVTCNAPYGGPSCDDPCHAERCEAMPYETLRECLESIPLRQEDKAATIESLRRTLAMYAFLDIIRRTTDPFHFSVQVDLMAELDRIAAADHARDIDFQEELAEFFVTLNDAHTLYLKPLAYRDLYFVLPLQFVAVAEPEISSGQHSILVDGVLDLDGWRSLYPETNLTEFVGMRVMSIEGREALLHMTSYAATRTGISRDAGTRFNLAVDGAYSIRSQVLRSVPSSDAVDVVLENVDTREVYSIRVPWVGYSYKALLGRDRLMGEYFRPPSAAPPASGRAEHAVLQDNLAHLATSPRSFQFSGRFVRKGTPSVTAGAAASDAPARHHRRPHLPAKEARRRQEEEEEGPPGPQMDLLTEDSGVSFYQIAPQVGVLRLEHFSPSSLEHYRFAVVDALAKAQDYNLTSLILDLRDNGGGYICLGYSVLHYLLPNFDPFGMYDMFAAPLARELAQAGVGGGPPEFTPTLWAPDNWVNVVSGKVYEDASWMLDGNEHTRGGVRGTYSQLFRDYCEVAFDRWIKPRHNVYQPRSIMILSHGYCGSTCAVFARHLQEGLSVRTTVVGGFPGSEQSVASFPGGQVYTLDWLLEDLAVLGINGSDVAPQPLPTTARLSFTIREIYSWTGGDDLTPLEFVFEKARFRLPYTRANWESDAVLYADVAPFLEVCDEGDTRECTLSGGVGENDCVDGKFSDVCRATVCNDGFHLDKKKKTCVRGSASQWTVAFLYTVVMGICLGMGYIWYLLNKKKRPRSYEELDRDQGESGSGGGGPAPHELSEQRLRSLTEASMSGDIAAGVSIQVSASPGRSVSVVPSGESLESVQEVDEEGDEGDERAKVVVKEDEGAGVRDKKD